MKLHFIFLFLATAIMLASCIKKQAPAEPADNLIKITQTQFDTDSMSLGGPALTWFDDMVECKGYIKPIAGGFARISLTTPGVVKNIFCNAGQQVTQGQVLFEISGNELIDLQRDYAETAALLMRLKSEFERTKSLYNERIGSEKEFISSESDYLIALSKYEALKLKLKAINLNTEKIEAGTLFSTYAVKAPINGYISALNVATGQHVDSQSTLIEIIDNHKLQLQLSVYAVDIPKLRVGQKITFHLSDNSRANSYATLTRIGNSINDETKAVDCYASFDQLTATDRINNEFVNAKIIINRSESKSLPLVSVVKSENDDYIFALRKKISGVYYFEKIKIETGRKSDQYVEILNDMENVQILLSGVYNISGM